VPCHGKGRDKEILPRDAFAIRFSSCMGAGPLGFSRFNSERSALPGFRDPVLAGRANEGGTTFNAGYDFVAADFNADNMN
jgi:hypothetical protein